ncbi:Uncharacterized protein PCOAH_00034700 [Plasmodium coatneyi]|uniref:Uncharacterized protein n=1 Tax=Plasmodium coatneyi TaxID=208452 RepID=A0A1B1E2Q5_9APIC|nr:Uncharacterized protein PCOAH_00034700 [Plasmodium coatneyi]ANQ09308.1 Uncharacterized protein PCOAH_00034700 [Plasmodium coatneyi]
MMGGEVIIEKNPESKFCVASKEPLCDSVIWDLLQNYYRRAAINAWKENVVPSFVTSNSKIAKDYARVIVNYMKDWFNSSECDRNVPIYILEIGAGHGKFTYLILRALSKYQKYFKSMNLPDRPFVYVFTDIAKDNITYCMNNGRLKRFINTRDSCDRTFTSKNNSYYDSEFEKNEEINYDSSTNTSSYSSSYDDTDYSDERVRNYANFSMLDFAYFDGNETEEKIFLQVSKSYIPENTPIVLICNYVLDSLLTDAWIVNGEDDFRRALLSVYSPNVEEDKTNADIMLRMSVTWDWEKVNIDEEIKKEKTDKPSDYLRKYKEIYTVLKLYSYFNQPLSFVLPVGAFILFDRILKLSGNKLLCLIGDKGYQSYEEFKGHRDPHIVVHGSLSFMVNLNAICLYFLSRGGHYIHTPYSDTFQIVTLLMHKNHYEGGDYESEVEEGVFLSGRNSLGDESNMTYSTLTDRLRMDKRGGNNQFNIIDYFKKSSKDGHLKRRYQNQLSTASSVCRLKGTTGLGRTDLSSRLSGRFPPNDQSVYKKMKKINLKNLNSMSIKFGGTISSFFDNMEQFPPDVLINWQKAVIHNINNNPANVSIKELISLLRYSNHDSDVFYNIRNVFTSLINYPNINGRTEKDILLDIKECYDNYYSLKTDEDIADVCGHVCMKFGEFEKAIYYMKQSLRNFKQSRHSSTYINIASCYKVLRNYHKSIKFIRCAIKLSNREARRGIPSGEAGETGHHPQGGRTPNNLNHAHDLLYNIQFCLNPITYAIVGVNHFVQNDGLYYLSFENRIKLKFIFLLAKEEEAVLHFMNSKYKSASYEKSTRNMDLSEVKVVRVYRANEVISMEEVDTIRLNGEEKADVTLPGDNQPEEQNRSYQNVAHLKVNLRDCLSKYNFQFCVIDAPWAIKADVTELMVDHSKHLFTYGTLSDCSKRSMEVISKYKQVSEKVSWVNNNYVHDESLYEARDALNHIRNVISVTVTHYSMNLYNQQNSSIPSANILTEDLCIILNALQVILNLNVTGLTANFLRRKGGEASTKGVTKQTNGEHVLEDAPSDIPGERKDNTHLNTDYVSLSGILTFQHHKTLPDEMNVHGNYLLMNNRNEEFLTKITFVGVHGSLCLKKTLSNWSVQVFNLNNAKVYEKSGRISASQNSNDVFISQYLIKTDGKDNQVKHFNEYDLKGSCKGSSESIDSDIDILEFSSDEEWESSNLKGSSQEESSLGAMTDVVKKECSDEVESSEEHYTEVNLNTNDDELFLDKNMDVLKCLPGRRFHSCGKDVYENVNLDESLIDVTVNNNCFYSRIVEGVQMSHKKGGAMVHFKYKAA